MILPSGHTARRTNLGLQCLCSSLWHNTVLLLFLPKYFTVAVFSQNKESTKFRCNGRGLKLGSLTSTGALAVLLIGFVLTIANIRSGSTLSWTKQLLSCSVLELKIFFSFHLPLGFVIDCQALVIINSNGNDGMLFTIHTIMVVTYIRTL